MNKSNLWGQNKIRSEGEEGLRLPESWVVKTLKKLEGNSHCWSWTEKQRISGFNQIRGPRG